MALLRKAESLQVELARCSRRQAPLALCNIPAVSLVCIVLWDVAPWFLISWWIGTVLHGGVIVAGIRRNWRATLDVETAQRVMRHARHVAWVTGWSWVIPLLYLYPAAGQDSQHLIYAVVMMSVGGVFGYSLDLKGFYGFLIPCGLAMVTALLISSSPHVMVGGVSVFFVAIFFLGRLYHTMVTDSLRMRFENAELLQELSAQKEIAEAANLAKSRFLAAASHDLRQPLHALMLLAGGAEERNRDPTLQPTITGIHRSVSVMLALFEDLLDISRIESQTPARKHFALQPMMTRLHQEFSSLAQHKGLKLRVRPTQAVVYSDPMMLERIVRNLMGNALKYTHSGGILVAVRPSSKRTHQIEVWDTGIGIPPSEYQRIFDDFYQVDNPQRTRKEGAGLGLAIVQRLVHSLGHVMTLRSQVGRGSVFKLEVEQGEPEAASAPARLDAFTPASSAPLAGACVLVFDDEEAVVSALETVLANWGVEVIGASSLSAIEPLTPGRAVDFMVVDYQIGPSLHGGQFIQRMRDRWGSTVPALILTGSLQAVDEQTRQLERVHVLAKPLAAGRLKALLTHELRQSSGLDEALLGGHPSEGSNTEHG